MPEPTRSRSAGDEGRAAAPATGADNETGLDALPPPPPAVTAPAPAVAAETPASAPAGAAAAPPRLPGYEILGELGQGGMGKVYRARQLSLDRLVAIKVIRAGDLADPAERARFLREAHALARLPHNHIVPVYEVGEHDGRPFLVMELVDGGSLDRRVRGQPQPARTAAALVEPLARALHAVHAHGLLHRDLKPANVLLAGGPDCPLERCTPKVTDFGLVKSLADAGPGVTPSQAVVGTPSYMAPEQAGGSVRTLGPAADVYALGAILYELLTGRPPFSGVTSVETLLRVLSDDPLPPRRLQPGVPRDLETVCLACLRKRPADRYASAAALADDLRRFLDGQPVRARPVGWLERGVKWARRSPRVAALSAALVLVVAAAFAAVTWQWRDARAAAEAEQRAHLDTAAALREARLNLYIDHVGRSDLEWLGNNAAEAEALLDRCPPELRRLEWDLLKRRCHDDLVTFAAGGPVNAVAFRRDGRRLATGGGNLFTPDVPGPVDVWDPDAGRRLRGLAEGHTGPVTAVAFSPDGRTLASASLREDVAGLLKGKRAPPRGEVLLRDLDGEAPARRLAGVGALAFDPEGKYLATPAEGEGVNLYDPTTGRLIRHVGAGTGWVVCLAVSPDGKHLATASAEEQGPPTLGRVVRAVRLWDVATGAPERQLGRLAESTYALAFSPDGRRLAAAAGRRVRLWDLGGGEPIDLIGHAADVFDVRFCPDGTALATASRDRTVKVWDATRGDERHTLRGHTDQVSGVAFDPADATGRRLASVDFAGRVKVWHVGSGRAAWALRAHDRLPSGIALSAGGDRLATVAIGEPVKVWDARARRLEHTLPAPGAARVALSRSGTLLAAFGGDSADPRKPGVIYLWDLGAEPRPVASPGHARFVTAAAFSPDGRYLLSASGDDRTQTPGALVLWDLIAGRAVESFRPPAATGCVEHLAYSPDGTHVATAGRTGGVRLCEAGTGREVRTFTGPPFYRVAFDPAGARLAAGTADGKVFLWDCPGGTERARWQAHRGVVSGLAFSGDGERLLTASYTPTAIRGELRVWDPEPGRELLRLPGQIHLALGNDGRRLAALAEGDVTQRAVLVVWETAARPGGEPAISRGP